MRKAVVNGAGHIANVILLEDGAVWTPPAGHTVVDDPDGKASPGGDWDGVMFTPPPFVPPDPDAVRQAELGQRMLQGIASLVEVEEFLVLRHGIVDASTP